MTKQALEAILLESLPQPRHLLLQLHPKEHLQQPILHHQPQPVLQHPAFTQPILIPLDPTDKLLLEPTRTETRAGRALTNLLEKERDEEEAVSSISVKSSTRLVPDFGQAP